MAKRKIYLNRYEKVIARLKPLTESDKIYLSEAKICLKDIKQNSNKNAIASYFNHIDFILENNFGVKIVLP